MLQPRRRTSTTGAAAALYLAVCALFSAGLVWTGGGLLVAAPGAEAPVSGTIRKRAVNAVYRVFFPVCRKVLS